MSFDIHYKNRKDRRKKYYDSRQSDRICRNHKSCSYCEDRRLYQYKKEIERVNQMIKEYFKNL